MSSSSIAAPVGYHRLHSHDGFALVRSEAVEWATAALTEFGTLFEAGTALTRTMSPEGGVGRGPVRTIEAPDGAQKWVVRHYRRGGLLAPLWNDRYPRTGKPRPVAELEASEALRAAGIRTPTVLAAAVYHSGVFYRGDLVTVFAEGATLIDFLQQATTIPEQERALAGVAAVVAEMAALGAYHVDLNARNILIDPDLDSPPWILDLDRMRFGGAVRAARVMSNRLLRSLAKLECNDAVLDLARKVLPR